MILFVIAVAIWTLLNTAVQVVLIYFMKEQKVGISVPLFLLIGNLILFTASLLLIGKV
jgi:hypothetical protein